LEENIVQDINSLIQRRLEELSELQKRNVLPFAYKFDIDTYSTEIINSFTEGIEKNVKAAGRIVAIRRMGKASFAHIRDFKGKIQIYLKKDDLGDEYEIFKLLDIGDIIGVEGYIFKTKTGEISIHTKKLVLLSKSIRPIPIVKEETDNQGNKIIHDQFVDKELRYRQRYVDLIVNPEVKEVFIKRSNIIT
jgi:lysyl-tRNA synthetase class 2